MKLKNNFIIDNYKSDNKFNNLINNTVKEITNKLYGPKYCKHCQQVQPVITYELNNSKKYERDKFNLDGYIINISFIGCQLCSVCYNEIVPLAGTDCTT